jgi:hypothetical protein
MTARRMLALVAAVAALAAGPARGETKDPKAVAVAERTMTAMGGSDAFAAQRYLTFRFTVERDGQASPGWLHVWDRDTGRYVLEGTTREGKALRVVFNVNTHMGEAWLDTVKAAGEDSSKYVEYAYARFINDTYWLLMPWKWMDPGVSLAYEGQQDVQGTPCDVVRLTFEGVGLTPNDSYWAYVSVDSGLMIQWQYLLQDDEGNPGTGDRTTFRWEDWEDVGGGIRLSRRKTRVGDDAKMAIVFPMVRISPTMDESAFRPGPAASGESR